jgi:hypothetical protein
MTCGCATPVVQHVHDVAAILSSRTEPPRRRNPECRSAPRSSRTPIPKVLVEWFEGLPHAQRVRGEADLTRYHLGPKVRTAAPMRSCMAGLARLPCRLP